MENIYHAWQLFRRGKSARADVTAFECDLERNVFELLEQLQTGTYRHSTYVPFTIFDPKQRRIHRASVRDRVVHQLLVNAIEPKFESHFMYDSFSCRKSKGTHAAVKRLRAQLRSASRNNSQKVYALKCDVRQLFASIDQTILLNLLKRHIDDMAELQLAQTIIQSFQTDVGKGMPLGNVTSQLFANIYLHELDWFVKQVLREKYYVRYCDDFVILSTRRQHLLELIPVLREFLAHELKLTLHPHKISLRSWTQGIDFVGYELKPRCTVLRTKTKRRMLRRVNSKNVSSYRGLCSHANAYQLQQLIATVAGHS